MSKQENITDNYTVYMKPIFSPTYYPNIPNSPLEQESLQSQKLYTKIEQKLSEYGKCILDFSTIRKTYLDNWHKFYSTYVEYNIQLIENSAALLIEKR